MSYTSSIITPTFLCFVKEFVIDEANNDMTSIDTPDEIGADWTDVGTTLLFSCFGFVFKELWDDRVRVSVGNKSITLAVRL